MTELPYSVTVLLLIAEVLTVVYLVMLLALSTFESWR